MDVERAVKDRIESEVGCTCVLAVPTRRPTEFACVERTGTRPVASGFAEVTTIAVQAWSDTRGHALALAEAARDACCHGGLCVVPDVTDCRVAGLYNYPDPDSEQPRYQLLLEVTYNA